MAKFFAYLGGLLGILGMTLMLLDHPYLGSPVLALAVILFLSGWFGNFRRKREKKQAPREKPPLRSPFDI